MSIFFIFIIGIFIGSFLNVVIFRQKTNLAKEMSIIHPARSFCPNCEKSLSFFELIPVFSFLFQKGKCKHCLQKISWQYPIVELTTGLLSVLVFLYSGANIQTLFYLLLLYFLIPLFVIDIKEQLLPDVLTYPILWLGLIFQMNFGDLSSGVIGAIVGYLSLWSIYWVFKLITGKEGMGYGDFKLTSAIGAWLGWQLLPYVFIVSATLGIIFFLVKQDKEKQIAFGPFLIIAFVLLLNKDIANYISAFVLT